MGKTQYTLDSTVRLIIRILVVILIFFSIRYLYGVLLPFVVGWLIAYFIHPLVCFIQYRIRVKSRIVSIILALLLVCGVLFGLGMLIIPIIYEEMSKIIPLVDKYLQDINVYPFINEVLIKNLQIHFEALDYKKLISLDTLNVIIGKVVPQFWGLMSNLWQVVLAIGTMFFTVLYVIFILKDYEKLSDNMIKLFPKHYRNFAQELQTDLSGAMNRYFRGQALICLIIAILYSIGFTIIGLPMAIVMGILMGILSFVPYLHSLGFIPVIFFAFVNSAETGNSLGLMLLGILIVFVIIQLSTDAFLVPRIMGKNMGLSPAIILLSLSTFGVMFGFLGLIIALPFTTIAIAYYKRLVIDKETIIKD
ncbi:MAG: AI-2E family transporter [Bacteroidota bacterium]